MGWKPWIALPVCVLLGLGLGWVLIPLASRWPFVGSPEVIVPQMPQHDYRGLNWMAFLPVLVATAIVTACTWLYFVLTEPPREIPYRPGTRER